MFGWKFLFSPEHVTECVTERERERERENECSNVASCLKHRAFEGDFYTRMEERERERERK